MKNKQSAPRSGAQQIAHFAARKETAHSAGASSADKFDTAALREKKPLNWQSPEYKHHEKGAAWYVIIGLLLALIAIYAVFERDWTFMLALFAAIIAYYYFIHGKKPAKLDVEISDFGVRVSKQEFKYGQIRYFWIIDKPEVNTLNLRLKKHFMPDITIFLDSQNPEAVRAALKSKILEIEKHESMTEALARLLKI